MRRRKVGILLAAVLILAAFEIHLPSGALHRVADLQGSLIFPDAAHPHQPRHVEPSAEAERPHCPACLHRAQASGGDLEPPSFGPVRVVSIAPAPVVLWPYVRASWRPSGCRAPPLA